MENKSGVYAIEHIESGKRYIGSAKNPRRRWKEHRRDLNRNCHFNRHLQYAWAQCGPDAFRLLVLENCEAPLLLEREGWWIKECQSADQSRGYNLGGPVRGVTSEEVRKKRSERLKGKPVLPPGFKHSEETRAAMSESRKGKPVSAACHAAAMSPQARAKMAETRRGKPSGMLGKKHSEATKLKISQAQQGRKASAELCALRSENRKKQRAPFTGGHHSEETKQKMSQIHKERCAAYPISEETRAKMRAAQQSRRDKFRCKAEQNL